MDEQNSTQTEVAMMAEQAPAPLVVCATRGGQGSRASQTAAIELAREKHARLVFLYVVDDSRFGDVEEARRPALRKELQWIGQALLQLARNRGRLNGVSAEMAILEGSFRKQLIAYVRETKPVALVIGAPRGTSLNVFGDDQVEQFAVEVEREAGVDVMLIRPEEMPDVA